jgi:hypothetical protein
VISKPLQPDDSMVDSCWARSDRYWRQRVVLSAYFNSRVVALVQSRPCLLQAGCVSVSILMEVLSHWLTCARLQCCHDGEVKTGDGGV